jgi:hypothetical protein
MAIRLCVPLRFECYPPPPCLLQIIRGSAASRVLRCNSGRIKGLGLTHIEPIAWSLICFRAMFHDVRSWGSTQVKMSHGRQWKTYALFCDAVA